jgi:hypothetical protein
MAGGDEDAETDHSRHSAESFRGPRAEWKSEESDSAADQGHRTGGGG